MKIVIEYVLIENFMINLIILKSCELILKEKGRFFWLSAIFGAGVTLVMPILHLAAFGAILLQAAVSIVVVCISFKFKTLKKFLQIYVCFYVATFLYGGICAFIQSYVGVQSILIMLLIVVLSYFCFKFLFAKINRKRQIENFCVEVQIENLEQTSRCKAFLDSGNLLVDPMTKKPVSLIDFKLFSSIFKDIDLEDVLRKSDKLKKLNLAHYISFNTLGQGNKILVFQVDKLCVGQKEFENAILGLSFKNFNRTFGTNMILHNNFASLCC